MRILITGGAGFIGYHAAKACLARGWETVIIDNFNAYYDPAIKEARIEELARLFPEVKIHRLDIADFPTLDSVFSGESFDAVCHLAAQAGVRYSLIDPFTYERTNVLGTLNLLELCRRRGPKNFIYASSSSVYGKNEKLPFSEDDRVDTPISLYAATKKLNEEMAHTYNHLYGINCTGLRFFTVYGPWGRPDMALFTFTEKILARQPIEINNFGRMARDFTYIDDIISGVVAALDKPFPCEIINLGRGEPVGLLDFISEIEANLGLAADRIMRPMQPGDVPATHADIGKARRLLGYEPRTSVKEGVRNFIAWYREYHGI